MPSQELEAQFDALVREQLDRAHRLVWRMLGGDDPAAAEDVTQDALLRAYRGLERFRGDARLETWFYRILVRQAQNHRRWRALRALWSAELVREPEADAEPGDVLLRRRIGDALDALSPPQRQAFVLVHLEGFSVREAAELMNKRENTTKTHLKRALAGLRRSLGDLKPCPSS